MDGADAPDVLDCSIIPERMNSNHRMLNVLYQILDNFSAPVLFTLAEDFLPLISNGGVRKKENGLVSESLETLTSQPKVLFYTYSA